MLNSIILRVDFFVSDVRR